MRLRVWGVENPMRSFNEMIGSTLGGSDGGVISIVSGNYEKGGVLYLFFKNILIDGHKQLFFLTLVPRKIFVITIITKALQMAFNHFISS